MTGSLDCRHHVSILLPQAQLPPSGCGGSCACGYLLPFALCWTGWCVSHDSLTKVAWSAHSWCVRTWSTQSRLRSGVVTERHKSVVGVTQVTCRVAPPPSEIWRNLLLGMCAWNDGMCAWNDVSPCAPRRFCCFSMVLLANAGQRYNTTKVGRSPQEPSCAHHGIMYTGYGILQVTARLTYGRSQRSCHGTFD